ncbi:MAG: hypothetical protein LBL92_06240, partial [Propionibacteriaceae bacterium]|nr:hypothetical protein [Propionibacteriaceae bacterium]
MAESAARSSAVLLTTGPDTGLAWHYGDPLGEQRRLEHGDAVVDLSNREVVTVTGPAGAVRWYWAEPGGGAALAARLRVEQAAGVSVDLRPDVAVMWLAVGVVSERDLAIAGRDLRGESDRDITGPVPAAGEHDPMAGVAVPDLVVRSGGLAQQAAELGGWEVFVPRDLVPTALT